MTEYSWETLTAVAGARREMVPEMINRALATLQDLVEVPDHVCTFTLRHAPQKTSDVAATVSELIGDGCRVVELRPVTSWRELLREQLPAGFLPGNYRNGWEEGSPARHLANGLAAYVIALLGRLLPNPAPAWELTVDCDDWYDPVYVDLAVQAHGEIWLVHLSVTD